MTFSVLANFLVLCINELPYLFLKLLSFMCAIVMDSELARLASFWNIPAITSDEDCYYSLLAEDGFFYTDFQKELECWKCYYKIKLVTKWMKLNEERKVHSLSCNIARDYPKNFSESTKPSNKAKTKSISNDYISNQLYDRNTTVIKTELINCGRNASKDIRLSGDNATLTNDVIYMTGDDCRKYINRSKNDNEPNATLKCSYFPGNQKGQKCSKKLNEDCNKDDYKYELNRLSTFQTWPKCDIVSPEVLARDGFIYTLLGDKVACVFCKGVLRAWERNDNPPEEHNRHYPTCPFVGGHDVGNIPISIDPRRKKIPPTAKQTSSVSFGVSNKLDVREIKARLDTPLVRNILSMGYSMDLIRLVLAEKLTTSGDDFHNIISFIEALNAKQSELNKIETQHNVDATAVLLPVALLQPTTSSCRPTSLTVVNKNVDDNQIFGESGKSLNNDKQHFTEASSSGSTNSSRSEAASGNEEKGKTKKKRNKKSTTTKFQTNIDQLKTQISQHNNNKQADKQSQKLNQTQLDNQSQIPRPNQTVPEKLESLPQSTIVITDKCNMCRQNEINIALIPCGHTYYCSRCAELLNSCPVCKTKIHSKIRVYLTS